MELPSMTYSKDFQWAAGTERPLSSLSWLTVLATKEGQIFWKAWTGKQVSHSHSFSVGEEMWKGKQIKLSRFLETEITHSLEESQPISLNFQTQSFKVTMLYSVYPPD